MVVAAGTLERQTQEGRGERLVAIGDILDAKLFGHAAAFDLLRMQAIEGRGQDLLIRRVRQQIAGQLLRDETGRRAGSD